MYVEQNIYARINNIGSMRWSACLVVNLIMVYNYGVLFMVSLVSGLRLNDGPDVKRSSVGWSLGGRTMPKFEVLSVDCKPFSLFHHSVLI